MENYIVKVIIEYDDYGGKEINNENPKTRRKVGELFHCTKERYEYLKSLDLVTLRGIDKK